MQLVVGIRCSSVRRGVISNESCMLRSTDRAIEGYLCEGLCSNSEVNKARRLVLLIHPLFHTNKWPRSQSKRIRHSCDGIRLGISVVQNSSESSGICQWMVLTNTSHRVY